MAPEVVSDSQGSPSKTCTSNVTSDRDHFVALQLSEEGRSRGHSIVASRMSAVYNSAPKERCNVWRQRLRDVMERSSTQLLLFFLLVYVLFVNNVATIARASDAQITHINVTLILSFALFCLEMTINISAASKPDVLFNAMEFIGTVSILLEVTWIASFLGLDQSMDRENVSKTAIITSRAGRVTKMIRLIRFVRALKIFIMIRRYFARRIEDGGKERSIAPSTIGNTLNDRISLLAAFLVMMTMMFVSFFNLHDADDANRAFMLLLTLVDSTQVESVVAEIKKFIDESDGGMVLRWIKVGSFEREWRDSGCCSIDRDIVHLRREGTPEVQMELDIAEHNATMAYLEILLGCAVIVELCVFVALLQRNTSRILIAPLERIFTTIQKNAHMIVSALDTQDPNGESSEIDTIEAAISKMSKLVAHISATGQQGNNVLKNYIQDEHATADTKAWLHDFTQGATASDFKKLKSPDPASIRSGLERMATFNRIASVDDQKQREHISKIMSSIDVTALCSWNFDVTQHTFEELLGAICVIFKELGLTTFAESFDQSEALVPLECLWEFISYVKEQYHDVPYHNFFHCCDVAHATFRFIQLLEHRIKIQPVESFALMIAALCHDMDHPGFQNSFLVETKHPLARMYNDRSVLENRHVSCLYTLVADHPEADVFQYLDTSTWKEVRKIIIECILHTDMVQHFGMVSKMEIFYELHAAEISTEKLCALFEDPNDRLFLFSLILHCADISNPVRPLRLSEKWADNVLNEFFRQGEEERRHGLPVSPLCDRECTSRPGSQINFLEYVIAPLFFQVVRIFPEMHFTMLHLKENRLYWEKICADEGRPQNEDEKAKAKKRLDAFLLKYKDAFLLRPSFCSFGRLGTSE